MFQINPSRDTYAVFGNPIAHSKSPRIHAAFARQTGQNLVYQAQWVGLEEFAPMLTAFQQAGGKGLNITVPFKQQAWELMDERRARAEKAGAVNTIWFDPGGRRVGDNTDGAGLVRDLTVNLGWPLAERDILLLGAGGAARGVLAPLLACQPASLTLANRTLSRAEQLVELFAQPDILRAVAFDKLPGQRFDLVINATSAGLQNELPPLPGDLFKPEGRAYDMMYGSQPTVFVEWAGQRGARASDGLGMLVEQAAESFYLWRGLRPDTSAVIAELRAG